MAISFVFLHSAIPSARMTRFIRVFLLITIPVFLLSCTSGKPAEAPGQKTSVAGYSMEIAPTDPTRNSVLILIPKGFSLSEAQVVWLVNGAVEESASQGQFETKRAAKGDMVQAKAAVRGAEILSNSVMIRNTPPAVSDVKFLPEVFKAGDRLSVEPAGTDADGDAVTYLFEWTVNGAPAGTEKSLGSPLKRGDNFSVKITPYDGVDYGTPVLLEREILNTPPVIVEHKEFSFNGSVYTYQVKASDPDGDALTYSLESPPAGMTIDASTGLLRWLVPKEFTGRQNVSIIADDGHGGTAKYGLEIIIQ